MRNTITNESLGEWIGLHINHTEERRNELKGQIRKMIQDAAKRDIKMDILGEKGLWQIE